MQFLFTVQVEMREPPDSLRQFFFPNRDLFRQKKQNKTIHFKTDLSIVSLFGKSFPSSLD